MTVGRELGEEDRLLHGGVAATHHDRMGAAEERGVAGGAVAHATAAEQLLAGHAQLLVLGAHREDHGARAVLILADPHAVNAARLLGELDAIGLRCQQARAEALRLFAEALHQLRAHDRLREARVVLDVGGLLQQAAPGEALDHERLEVRARCVERGRVAGGATADDDHLLEALLSHVAPILP